MRRTNTSRPPKPYDGFPLFAHACGQWGKKIHGQIYYFGVWEDPQAAVERYLAERDYLHNGLAPPDGGETIADVLNSFRGIKLRAMERDEITERTYSEYVGICDTIANTFGKNRPVVSLTYDDLDRLRTLLGRNKKNERVSPLTHKRLLTYARMVFHHANERMGLAVKYKDALATPPAKQLRKARNKIGERLFTAKEIKKLVKKACPDLRAMIYLGINCGFGNSDCLLLPVSTLDLDNGFHNFPRPKTEVARRCPLWPETVQALRAVITDRPTVFKHTWNRHVLARRFKNLCVEYGVYREGITTFYTLRRTFETIATTADVNQAVINSIMGHAPRNDDMSAVYRQRVFDDSLRRCTDHVKAWLDGSIKLA